MRGVKMHENFLHVADRENRCVWVVILLFMVIQLLLLIAFLLPKDPPILEIPSYPSSGGKVRLVFKSTDAALRDAIDTNATLPIDRVGLHPTDNNAAENEGRFATEPPDKTITTGNEEMNPADPVIISRLSHEVTPNLYDVLAASGTGVKPSDRTTTVDVKEEYDFAPFPDWIRNAKQMQSPNEKVDSDPGDNATTADEGKPVDPTVKSDVPRFRQGWKDKIADRFFKYDVAGVKVNPKDSPASDLGGREPLPAMNGLALLPLLDRLHSLAKSERARTASVAASASAPAAAPSEPQAVAVACAAILLLKAKYFG